MFGVMAADDPAISVVRRLEHDFPAVPVRLVVSGERLGSNLKVSNLANMLPAARFETLLISDSDMRVTPDYLRRVSWRPPAESSEEGIAEELANLGARQWQIELVSPLIAEAFQDPQPLPPREAKSAPAAAAAATAEPVPDTGS